MDDQRYHEALVGELNARELMWNSLRDLFKAATTLVVAAVEDIKNRK